MSEKPDDTGGYCCIMAAMKLGHDEDCPGWKGGEVSEMTPETLRDGKNIAMGYDDMCHWLDAHASAWEADRDYLEAVERSRDTEQFLIGRLEDRIEELEKVLRMVKDWMDEPCPPWPNKQEAEKAHKISISVNAALAAEEER